MMEIIILEMAVVLHVRLKQAFTCVNAPLPSVCTTICGDGKVLGAETCDDGSNDGVGCALGCMGNATGWKCTGGGPTSASTCNPICGDGILIS